MHKLELIKERLFVEEVIAPVTSSISPSEKGPKYYQLKTRMGYSGSSADSIKEKRVQRLLLGLGPCIGAPAGRAQRAREPYPRRSEPKGKKVGRGDMMRAGGAHASRGRRRRRRADEEARQRDGGGGGGSGGGGSGRGR